MFARQPKWTLFWISLIIFALLLTACTSATSTPSPTPEPVESEETVEATAYPVETAEDVIVETEAYPVETVVEAENLNPLAADPIPHTFRTEDGIELQGTFYPAEFLDAPLIVLMHWAGGDQFDWAVIAPWLQNRGIQPDAANGASWLNLDWFPPMPEGVSFNVFTFTFRDCEGGCKSFNREGWLLDVQTVMSYIRGLENVDLSRVATMGASIGADGAAAGCAAYNAQSSGCMGALSLSPGGYLKDTYPDEVVALEAGSPPVHAWCLYAAGDTESAGACQSAEGDLYQTTEYEGSAHGMVLLSPDSEPNPLTRMLEFLNEIGICDSCP